MGLKDYRVSCATGSDGREKRMWKFCTESKKRKKAKLQKVEIRDEVHESSPSSCLAACCK